MLTPAPPIREKTKTIVITILLIIAAENICVCQEFVQLWVLEKSLKEQLIKEREAEKEIYNFKEKGKWLKYVPNVGLQFGLPSVTWGTGTVYKIKNDKQIKAAALQSLEQKYQARYEQELKSLQHEYKKYRVKFQQLIRAEARIMNDSLIFAIHEEAYAKNEIAPLEFYTKRKAYFSTLEVLEKQREELELFKLSIYQTAYFTREEIGKLD